MTIVGGKVVYKPARSARLILHMRF